MKFNNQIAMFSHVSMLIMKLHMSIMGRIQKYNIATFIHVMIQIVFHSFDNKADIPRLIKCLVVL